MPKRNHAILAAQFAVTCAFVLSTLSASADDLRERLEDVNGAQTEDWVYNDIPRAMDEARRVNKPLFVTFRCVPCEDCAAFDADVASGNERVRELAKEKFVSVRQVEMKGVDLNLFQFDHDLNWAAMFINADGVVYARYGTQSADGADAYNSIKGLMSTMNHVLELHANYPGNRAELSGKRGAPKPYSSALEMPGLANPAKYAQETTQSNCIHCHNIHDAEHQSAFDAGKWVPEMMWKYPLPDNIGLRIDRTSGTRIHEITPDSAASSSSLKAGEDIVRMNGQPITSIADMQWVLHHLPGTAGTVEIEGSKSGRQKLSLADGWRKQDFSWRGSMWNAPPRVPIWLPEVSDELKTSLGIPESDVPLEVRWINLDGPGGRQAYADGLREQDIVIALEGEPIRLKSEPFHAYIKMKYKVGQQLPLTVLRDGKKMSLNISLVE